MISQKELGAIISRVAIADEKIASAIILAAQHAGDGILPKDVEKLFQWERFVKIMRTSMLADYCKTGSSSSNISE